MRIDGETLMNVITRFRLIGAPAKRPDACRPREALPRTEDDADRFVVENERKTGHALSPTQREGQPRNTVNCL